MITGRQVRAARALLNWKQEMLAEKAVVALTALKRMESERGLPVHDSTRDQVRRALEAAGIFFIKSDRGRGVMLLRERDGCQPRTELLASAADVARNENGSTLIRAWPCKTRRSIRRSPTARRRTGS